MSSPRWTGTEARRPETGNGSIQGRSIVCYPAFDRPSPERRPAAPPSVGPAWYARHIRNHPHFAS